MENPLLQRISGKPCIRGTHIRGSLILDMLAAQNSIEEILEAYPHLKREDILACIAYGSEMSRENDVAVVFNAA